MKTALLLLGLATLVPATALAQHGGHGGHAATPPPCAKPRSVDCASVATPTFAPDGTLWLAWVKEGQVWVAPAPHTAPVAVTQAKTPIDDNGENRPKLAVDGKGGVFVTYTVKSDKPYSGRVMFSRSTDGGRSFEPPRPITDDAHSQRFDALTLAPSGRLYAAWIDKRGAAGAKDKGHHYAGAALAMAWSDDGGRTFSKAQITQDHSCECCRLGLAVDGNLPVIMWRHVFGTNVRDHAIMRFTDAGTPGPLQRVSEDAWAIEACPHHGPGLAVSDGAAHAVWFTQGAKRKGLFYARSDGGAFSEPMPLGDAANAPGHASVAAAGKTVVVAWKEFDGEKGSIKAITSTDAGASWSAPAAVMTTEDASDQPLLVSDGKTVHLSWATRAEGWRFAAVAGEAMR